MNGDAINAISYYALTGLLFLSAVPFFYIIIFNSPSTIRVYRNTILNLACWYTIGMGTFGLFLQPIQITYFGKSCAKFAGLVSYFGFRLHVLVIVVVAIGVANVTISMLICFFYRYDQIRLRDQPTHLSSIRGVTMCAVLHVLMSLFAGCVAFVIVNGGEIIKHNGLFLLCFGDSNYSTIMKVAVVVATVFGFVFTERFAAMSGQAQEVGEFYTLDELELLTEVAIKGTLNGRRVPVVVKDAAKHYRDSIIRQVIRPSVVLSSEAHEVNETLLALSEEKMRTKEAFDSDVFESKSENDNGDGTTEEMVPEFDQDEDSDIEILSVHGVDVGPIHPVLNLAEDNKDIKEDNKDVKEDNKFGLNLETPTMQTLSSILTQSLNSPLPLCRSTRISGIWQCQKCLRQLRVHGIKDLHRHAGSHHADPAHCVVEGCRAICKSSEGLRRHLHGVHGLTMKKLTQQQHQRLSTLRQEFRKKTETLVNEYFPPTAYIGTYQPERLQRA
ncbi:hypothetical protein QR680_016416 [Steinernema hermaphroditum]|uniref:Uncharacterized protein n=1 Tax=Steinernema hermaphroditum TaxID=289476 RepID=A0AA39HDM1_9BILA|nr:hypothetical protein QR680_016416 [Steinernema hermaphroditum]